MRKKYLVEINYKSGIQKRFWVYDLNTKGGLDQATWESVSRFRPVVMNIDEVESIWTVKESYFAFGGEK